MLHINDLSFRLGGRQLFDSARMMLPAGTKAALVGRNGAGKTTLFRIICDELSPDSGEVRLPAWAKLGRLTQEAPSGSQSLLDFVVNSDHERATLMNQAEHETDPARISDIHTRLADIDAHSAEARAGRILYGLGFDTIGQTQPLSEFSGGWRMRVALAGLLLSAPDLLLLDEPTNYLDVEGVIWLEAFLARYPHSALVISHDRQLLNQSISNVIHLDQGKLTTYRGNHDQFERQRREQQALQLKLKKRQDDQRRHLQSFVERFRAKASKARQAQSRVKALARLEPTTDVIAQHIHPITLPSPLRPLPSPLIQLDQADAGYDGKPVLRDMTLRLNTDDRIALLGKNGNGKTTLAKLLSGRLPVTSGTCKRHHRLQIGYFAPDQLDELPIDASAYDLIRKKMDGASESEIRARTAQIGLDGEKMDRASQHLSGGERARLALSLISFDAPHLLILDEPTNHLDIETRQQLIEALALYQGAVVLISHDRHLIESCADNLWLVAEGRVTPFDGDMNDYSAEITHRARMSDATAPKSTTSTNPAARRRANAAHRAELAPLRQQINGLERHITDLAEQRDTCDQTLATADIFSSDPSRGAALSKQRAALEKQIGEAEELWLVLSEKLEQSQQD